MDAPIYPPALRYRRPRIVPVAATTGRLSVSDLLAIPAARALLLEEIPGVEARLRSPQMKPHLGNLSFRSLAVFGIVRAADLDRVDARLARLGIMAGALR